MFQDVTVTVELVGTFASGTKGELKRAKYKGDGSKIRSGLVYAKSEILTSNNFTLTDTGVWLVNFYSPRCGYSKRFRPYWDIATDRYARTRNGAQVKFGLTDCRAYGDALCQHVTGYPQQFLYADGEMVEEFPRSDDRVQPIIDYLDQKMLEVNANRTAHAANFTTYD